MMRWRPPVGFPAELGDCDDEVGLESTILSTPAASRVGYETIRGCSRPPRLCAACGKWRRCLIGIATCGAFPVLG